MKGFEQALAVKHAILVSQPFVPDMGRITLESNALNLHYLSKMCIELALALLDFEKVMH